jgi:hypothetical protein
MFLLKHGFSRQDVYEMPLRQVLHYAKVGVKLDKITRLSQIGDTRVAGCSGDDPDYNRYINSLRYE